MMAGMLTQLPLPLLPAAAEEIAAGVGLVTGPDGGLVVVHGLATFAWDAANDKAGRRLAAVQLVRLRAASQGQVAEAFGVDPARSGGGTRRWPGAGWPGWSRRRGPRRASKLTAEMVARIAALDAAGASLREIAAAAGVSTFSVRNALGRVQPRAGGQPPATAGGEEDGQSAAGEETAPDQNGGPGPGLGEPRAEGATRVPPGALGRVLGLDRAPEVKTIRRKLAELAAAGQAGELIMALARHHAQARPDALGFLYVGGHARAYFGTRQVQKTHVARLKFPAPATLETWATPAETRCSW
jgi:transposase